VTRHAYKLPQHSSNYVTDTKASALKFLQTRTKFAVERAAVWCPCRRVSKHTYTRGHHTRCTAVRLL